MRFRTTTAAAILVTAALIAAPLAPASAHDHWGHSWGHNGGLIFGLGAAAGALVVGAATIATAPFVALAGPAPAPRGVYVAPAYAAPPPAAYYYPPPAPTTRPIPPMPTRPPAPTTPIRGADGADTGDAASNRARRGGGRPSRVDAEKLGERIVAAATELFLAEGYSATSIEAVARRAGISKRTFYARFPDKAALFGAVVQSVVARIRPSDDAALFTGGTLEEILLKIAQAILRAALTQEALALNRILIAEAGRFPELAATAAARGSSQEGIDRIGALLHRMLGKNGITADRCKFAAAQFLFMVLAVPQRRALGLGKPMTAAECDSWAHDSVRLFLDGVTDFR